MIKSDMLESWERNGWKLKVPMKPGKVYGRAIDLSMLNDDAGVAPLERQLDALTHTLRATVYGRLPRDARGQLEFSVKWVPE